MNMLLDICKLVVLSVTAEVVDALDAMIDAEIALRGGVQ